MAEESLDDLIGDGAPAAPAKKAAVKKAPAAKKAPPAKKAVAKKAAATPAPAAKKAAGAPAKKAATATSAKGQGKFYFSAEDRAALAKKIGALKTPITTQEAATRYDVETFKARRAMVDLVAEKKGKLAMTGSVLTFTPSK